MTWLMHTRIPTVKLAATNASASLHRHITIAINIMPRMVKAG